MGRTRIIALSRRPLIAALPTSSAALLIVVTCATQAAETVIDAYASPVVSQRMITGARRQLCTVADICRHNPTDYGNSHVKSDSYVSRSQME
jgi:hypothetical protein